MVYVTSLCHNHIPLVSHLLRIMRRSLSRIMSPLIPPHVPLSITGWISLRRPTRKPWTA